MPLQPFASVCSDAPVQNTRSDHFIMQNPLAAPGAIYRRAVTLQENRAPRFGTLQAKGRLP